MVGGDRALKLGWKLVDVAKSDRENRIVIYSRLHRDRLGSYTVRLPDNTPAIGIYPADLRDNTPYRDFIQQSAA